MNMSRDRRNILRYLEDYMMIELLYRPAVKVKLSSHSYWLSSLFSHLFLKPTDMDSELAQLTLNEEEEEILQIHIDPRTDKRGEEFQVVGCFLTANVIHFSTMRSTMANLWHPVYGVQIQNLGTKRRSYLKKRRGEKRHRGMMENSNENEESGNVKIPGIEKPEGQNSSNNKLIVVSDLIDSSNRKWRIDVIMNTFQAGVAKKILQIPLAETDHEDFQYSGNQLVHEQKISTEIDLAKRVKRQMVEYEGVKAIKAPSNINRNQRNQEDIPRIQIQFDATFDNTNFQSASGLVVWSLRGEILVSKSTLINNVPTPFAAKALACLEAVKSENSTAHRLAKTTLDRRETVYLMGEVWRDQANASEGRWAQWSD
ncbi:hypothetical protein J1N35_007452 [Gossypium stocksii]|uniref:RNase H type-1 domain-containing protein n=1 Tax=Gossypium stocksii TaxID=47602 RepID=A0A9D4AF97_9ROSI|nr:hypothetical protein J1N35_007452 [Gossypium stocksii]